MSDLLLKKVDRRLYLQRKAEASAQGKTVGEVFNEAVRVWLMVRQGRDVGKERNMEAYIAVREEIPKRAGTHNASFKAG